MLPLHETMWKEHGIFLYYFLQLSVNLYFKIKSFKKLDGAMHEKVNIRNTKGLTQHMEHGKKAPWALLFYRALLIKQLIWKHRFLYTIQTISAESMTWARIPEFSYQMLHEISYAHGKIFFHTLKPFKWLRSQYTTKTAPHSAFSQNL